MMHKYPKKFAAMAAVSLLSTSLSTSLLASDDSSNRPLRDTPFSVINRPEKLYECYVGGDSAFQLFGLTRDQAVELIINNIGEQTVHNFIANSIKNQSIEMPFFDYLKQVKTNGLGKDWKDNRTNTGAHVEDFKNTYGLLAALAFIQRTNLYFYTQVAGQLQLNHVFSLKGIQNTVRALYKEGNYNRLLLESEIVRTPKHTVIDFSDDEPDFKYNDISRIIDGQGASAEEIDALKQYLVRKATDYSKPFDIPYYQMILARFYIDHGTAEEAGSMIGSMQEIINTQKSSVQDKYNAYVYLGQLYMCVGDYVSAAQVFDKEIPDAAPLSYYPAFAKMILERRCSLNCVFTGLLLNESDELNYVEKLFSDGEKEILENETYTLEDLAAPLYLSHAKQKAKISELRALLMERRRELAQEQQHAVLPLLFDDEIEDNSEIRSGRKRVLRDDDNEVNEDPNSKHFRTLAFNSSPTSASDVPLLSENRGVSTSSSSLPVDLEDQIPWLYYEGTDAEDEFETQRDSVPALIERHSTTTSSSSSYYQPNAQNQRIPDNESIKVTQLREISIASPASTTSSSSLDLAYVKKCINNADFTKRTNEERARWYLAALNALDRMGITYGNLRGRALIGLGNTRFCTLERSNSSWYLDVLECIPAAGNHLLRAEAMIGLGNTKQPHQNGASSFWFIDALDILPISDVSLRARAMIGLGAARHSDNWGEWYRMADSILKDAKWMKGLKERAKEGMMEFARFQAMMEYARSQRK